jgi:hypothetical protein
LELGLHNISFLERLTRKANEVSIDMGKKENHGATSTETVGRDMVEWISTGLWHCDKAML